MGILRDLFTRKYASGDTLADGRMATTRASARMKSVRVKKKAVALGFKESEQFRTDAMHALQLEVAELRGFTSAQTNYNRDDVPAPPQQSPSIVVNVPPIQLPNVTLNVPEQPAPVVNVHVPEQPAPVVNVEGATIHVPQQPAPSVTFTVPQQLPPSVTFTIPEQPAPVVNINVPEATEYEETSEIVRDGSGLISKIRKLFRRKG